jgi:hypothetical protein
MQESEKKDSARWVIGVGLGLAALFGSLMVALIVFYLADTVAPGLVGRRIHPPGVLSGLLIGLTTIGLYVKGRVTAGQMVAALILVEGVVIVLVGYYAGTWALNRFTGMWLLGVNLYIGLPCLAGLLVARQMKEKT